MGRPWLRVVSVFLFALGACGPTATEDDSLTGGPDAGSSTWGDVDGDGYTEAEGDCNDSDAAVNPGAVDDTCDGLDNDCNGVIDDAFNADGDLYSTCAGDCDDTDPSTYPGATEIDDDKDNDCDGIADNHRSDYDDDGDGFTEDEGDCNDDEPMVNPGAVEVDVKPDGTGGEEPEGVDNDCDGLVDEGQDICDTGLDVGVAGDYAKAMDLCKGVTSAVFTGDADARSRNIVDGFGDVYAPFTGSNMAVIASGLAVDESDAAWVNPITGTAFTNTSSHPDPQPDPADGCGMADPASVNDYLELTLEIDVPGNANSLSYDFAFMSAEYPVWLCTQYDDTFLAILESSSFNGNISFDENGRPVTINIGFFDVCPVDPLHPDCTGDAELAGTGYQGTGGTGWLHTIAPVTPGEHITLRFVIFDEGDHIWDSLVLIDNFRWEAEPVDAPITIPIRVGESFRDFAVGDPAAAAR